MTETLWIFAALGTAICFAVSGLIAFEATRALGALTFSFLRMTIVAVGFLVWVLIFGFDWSIGIFDWGLLVASGVLGVFLADTFRYSSLVRVGPQLQSLLNTTTAPFALLLGFVILGQTISFIPLVGTMCLVGGIIVATFGRSDSAQNRFQPGEVRLSSGISFGLASALMQAGSVLVAAPVMLKGADPISATVIRAGAGAFSLALPVLLSGENRTDIFKIEARIAKQVFLSALIGTGLGMTLQLYALANGPIGIVSALTATVPIIILPLIWILGKSRPTLAACVGATLGVLGVLIISNFT